jgi:hypothetical protein
VQEPDDIMDSPSNSIEPSTGVSMPLLTVGVDASCAQASLMESALMGSAALCMLLLLLSESLRRGIVLMMVLGVSQEFLDIDCLKSSIIDSTEPFAGVLLLPSSLDLESPSTPKRGKSSL